MVRGETPRAISCSFALNSREFVFCSVANLSLLPLAWPLAWLPLRWCAMLCARRGHQQQEPDDWVLGFPHGPLAGFGRDIGQGAEAALAQINARGGIHGRMVQL